jgi:predicted protein tyrosine phosphatase
MNRSRTAEELFSSIFETKSAGLFNDTPITEQELGWADIVMVMEEEQRHELSKRFPQQYLKKQIINLNIPDIYHFNQPNLVRLLKQKMDKLF